MSQSDEGSRDQRGRRGVVSFVRRGSRMTAAQQNWLSLYSSRWILPIEHDTSLTLVPEQPELNLEEVFSRQAPMIVEIGSGHGDTLVAAATAHPEWNFLGFEVFDASLAITLGRLAEARLSNVRLVKADAVSGLTHLIADESVNEIWVFFPDPWPKRRHHKRRIISDSFAELARTKLTMGGMVRLATDWEDYARAMAQVMGSAPGFELVSTARCALRPITKFEARGIARHRVIGDFAFQKVDR